METESAEVRLIKALQELSSRIWMTASAEHRAQLRKTAAVLRAELVELIQAMPIPDESDYERMQRQELGQRGMVGLRS